jgi:hypothetical protein
MAVSVPVPVSMFMSVILIDGDAHRHFVLLLQVILSHLAVCVADADLVVHLVGHLQYR